MKLHKWSAIKRTGSAERDARIARRVDAALHKLNAGHFHEVLDCGGCGHYWWVDGIDS